MMPNPSPMPMKPPMGPESGGPPPGGPGAMPPGAGAEGNPDQIKGQLVLLLRKAKEMADANGVDWNDVMAEVEGNKSKAEVPLPRPPSP
jgi:hypothetical protein